MGLEGVEAAPVLRDIHVQDVASFARGKPANANIAVVCAAPACEDPPILP